MKGGRVNSGEKCQNPPWESLTNALGLYLICLWFEEHVARIGERRGVYKVLVGKS